MVLLVGAALLRSFANVTGSIRLWPDGFTFRVSLPTTYPDGPQRMTFYDALTTRLEALLACAARGSCTLPLKGDYLPPS